MPAPASDLPSPPPHVAARLPSAMLLRQALLASIRTVPAGQRLTQRFGDSAASAALMADPCRRPPPR